MAPLVLAMGVFDADEVVVDITTEVAEIEICEEIAVMLPPPPIVVEEIVDEDLVVLETLPSLPMTSPVGLHCERFTGQLPD